MLIRRSKSLPDIYHIKTSGNEYNKIDFSLRKIRNHSLTIKKNNFTFSSTINNAIKAKVIIKKIDNDKEFKINASHYIYLGSCDTSIASHMGISLDENGDLIFIKGNCRDLFSGVFNRVINKKKFKLYNATELSQDNNLLKFINLFVHHDGRLIGRCKENDKLYFIDFMSRKKNNFTCIMEEYLMINFSEIEGDKIMEDLLFNTNNKGSFLFYVKEHSLFMDRYLSNGKNDKRRKINLPFRKKIKVISAKKNRMWVQLEIIEKNEIKILYLNPEDININHMCVRNLSETPPQNLLSSVGFDGHEKYESGQPFSYRNVSNFSSKNIPLFSSIINNSRNHIKKAISSQERGNKTKMMLHCAKSIDPGIRAIAFSTRNIFIDDDKMPSNKKEDLYLSHINILNEKYKKFVNTLSNTVVNGETVSDKIFSILKKIHPEDTILLSNQSYISFFFGVAMSGIPFAPGWFVGALGSISKTHKLELSFINEKEINFTFSCKRNLSGVMLAGTGQGLERTLKKVVKWDFLTLLPAEANAILALSKGISEDITFNIAKDDIAAFLNGQFVDKASTTWDSMKDAILTITKEVGFDCFLEAKSEIRLQLGNMVNEETYLVSPRQAIGKRLALTIFSLKKKIAKEGRDKKKEKYLDCFSVFFDIFREIKIMPIIISDTGQSVFCYPLPLTEETVKIKEIINKNLIKDVFTKVKMIGLLGNSYVFLEKFKNTLNKIHENIEIIYASTDYKKIALSIPLKINKKITKEEEEYNEACNTYEIHKILKKIKKELHPLEMKSSHKETVIKLHATYTLEQNIKLAKDEINKQFISILEKKPQSIKEQEENLISVYHKIENLKKSARLQLTKIVIKGTGEIFKEKSLIPTVILNFKDRKAFSYIKKLAEIKLEYKNGTKYIDKILEDYKFF